MKNFTLKDSLYRIDAPVGVIYGSDMGLVRATLERTAHDFPHRTRQNEPAVLLRGFGSSSVDWIVSVWIDDPRQLRTFRSQLNEAIWKALREADITIAFPQLDVHFDPGIERSVAAMAGSSRPGVDR